MTKSSRRNFLRLAAGAAALPALPCTAMAQVYPSRPINPIIPFPPGGATDTIARVLVPRRARSLGQNIIVENITGADGSIGVGRAARARPDGYTLHIGLIDTQVFNGAFYALPYDVLNDFAPIAPLVTTPPVLFGKRPYPQMI
jgi:tripartite-type tricarboxylate transporter receptor subunit TctC